ncbi:MAG: hypothetical protein WCU88_10255 [Elusimicrobiota bacterium]|jgi:hypothetical protein
MVLLHILAAAFLSLAAQARAQTIVQGRAVPVFPAVVPISAAASAVQPLIPSALPVPISLPASVQGLGGVSVEIPVSRESLPVNGAVVGVEYAVEAHDGSSAHAAPVAQVRRTLMQAKPLPVSAGLQGLRKSLDKARSTQSEVQSAAFSALMDQAFDGKSIRKGVAEAVHAQAGAFLSQKNARPALAQRSLESIEELNIGTYNLLNLFQMVGKYLQVQRGGLQQLKKPKAKEEQQRLEQGKAILDLKLDVLVVQEVENVEALEAFNRHFLGGAYRVFLIEGNDERGIDIGFLVKKDLPMEIEQRSHKGEKWNDPVFGAGSPIFSRDLTSLIFRAQGQVRPLFIFFGGHFKSKRDRPGDRESAVMRRAQMERAAEIMGRYRKEFGNDVPLMLAADFNGDLNAGSEFAAFWKKAGLINSLDLGDAPVPMKDRVTHTYHPGKGPVSAVQMDGVLVSASMRRLVARSGIYRYKNPDGSERPIPKTRKERDKNPSDHFPLWLKLKFQPLLKSLGL